MPASIDPAPFAKAPVDLFEKARQLGMKEGIKATAKHFKAPVRATLQSVMAPRELAPRVVAPTAEVKSSTWMAHVKETQASTGGSLKDAMRVAKTTYKK